MRVALRVDVSRQIGTGHLLRCAALARALRDVGADVCFLMRDLGLDRVDWLRAQGFESTLLPPPAQGLDSLAANPAINHAAWAGVTDETDVMQTVQALRGSVIDWLVIDHYSFDQRWHRAVATALGCRIAVIDDLADRDLAADLLVDHNQHRDHRAKYGEHLPSAAVLLGGPRYALLGAVFANAPRCQIQHGVDSIGVFMGGVDECNASLGVLAAIDSAGFEGRVEIVTTSANPHLSVLGRAVAARQATTLSIDLPNLAAFFARHDLQIGAGGGATWERCCIGAPTLAVVVADNQLAVVPELVSLGVLATAQPASSLDAAVLGSAIREMIAATPRRRALAERSRALVDGLGARRVALRMACHSLTVRPAIADDAAMLHQWRNHPETRRVSRDAGEISLADHRAWLQRTLTDAARTLLVGEVGCIPVGAIRFDRLAGASAEVSLYLDPGLHGLGLGAVLLHVGERSVPQDHHLLAAVLPGNEASTRLFAGAGYLPAGPGAWIKTTSQRIPRSPTP